MVTRLLAYVLISGTEYEVIPVASDKNRGTITDDQRQICLRLFSIAHHAAR